MEILNKNSCHLLDFLAIFYSNNFQETLVVRQKEF